MSEVQPTETTPADVDSAGDIKTIHIGGKAVIATMLTVLGGLSVYRGYTEVYKPYKNIRSNARNDFLKKGPCYQRDATIQTDTSGDLLAKAVQNNHIIAVWDSDHDEPMIPITLVYALEQMHKAGLRSVCLEFESKDQATVDAYMALDDKAKPSNKTEEEKISDALGLRYFQYLLLDECKKINARCRPEDRIHIYFMDSEIHKSTSDAQVGFNFYLQGGIDTKGAIDAFSAERHNASKVEWTNTVKKASQRGKTLVIGGEAHFDNKSLIDAAPESRVKDADEFFEHITGKPVFSVSIRSVDSARTDVDVITAPSVRQVVMSDEDTPDLFITVPKIPAVAHQIGYIQSLIKRAQVLHEAGIQENQLLLLYNQLDRVLKKYDSSGSKVLPEIMKTVQYWQNNLKRSNNPSSTNTPSTSDESEPSFFKELHKEMFFLSVACAREAELADMTESVDANIKELFGLVDNDKEYAHLRKNRDFLEARERVQSNMRRLMRRKFERLPTSELASSIANGLDLIARILDVDPTALEKTYPGKKGDMRTLLADAKSDLDTIHDSVGTINNSVPLNETLILR